MRLRLRQLGHYRPRTLQIVAILLCWLQLKLKTDHCIPQVPQRETATLDRRSHISQTTTCRILKEMVAVGEKAGNALSGPYSAAHTSRSLHNAYDMQSLDAVRLVASSRLGWTGVCKKQVTDKRSNSNS